MNAHISACIWSSLNILFAWKGSWCQPDVKLSPDNPPVSHPHFLWMMTSCNREHCNWNASTRGPLRESIFSISSFHPSCCFLISHSEQKVYDCLGVELSIAVGAFRTCTVKSPNCRAVLGLHNTTPTLQIARSYFHEGPLNPHALSATIQDKRWPTTHPLTESESWWTGWVEYLSA